MTNVHRGHVEREGVELGAMLTIEPGKVTLEIAGTGTPPAMPERIDLIRFRSNTGYFTVLKLLRRSMNMRFGVGSLSTYEAWIALESVHFETADEIRSRSWSMVVGDVAKILHVNGVEAGVSLSPGLLAQWTIRSPEAVELACPEVGLKVRFGQRITIGGSPIDGPTITLRYPLELVFEDEVGPDTALTTMHRARLFLSMVMGRLLPILEASLSFEESGRPLEAPIHGIRTISESHRPKERLLLAAGPAILAPLLGRWLDRFERIDDAIGLHVSGLQQRTLPTELRFQIFAQALEGLHRKTAAKGAPVDVEPVLSALRNAGVADDMVDRIKGILSMAQEPGLRRRLKDYWKVIARELKALRPGLKRDDFIERVVQTRNHYAHRTDLEPKVLQHADLWDATETLKAISHMALLLEVGADVAGMGKVMLDREFVQYSAGAE